MKHSPIISKSIKVFESAKREDFKAIGSAMRVRHAINYLELSRKSVSELGDKRFITGLIMKLSHNQIKDSIKIVNDIVMGE